MTNKTYKFKFLAVMLGVAMCLALMLGVVFASGASVAYADDPVYETIGNATASGTGWSFDSATETLTLDGYNGKAISLTDAVKKVVLKGTNTITLNALTNTSSKWAVALYGNDFEITSDDTSAGKLTINADLSAVTLTESSYTVFGIGIKSGLKISGNAAVAINVKGQGVLYGIGFPTFFAATLNGIAVQDKATIDVTTEVVGETTYQSYGVYVDNNTEKGISFSGEGAKNITMKGNSKSWGVGTSHIDISGTGKVTIDMQVDWSRGLLASHGVTIKDNANVEIKNALWGIIGNGKGASTETCSTKDYKLYVENSTLTITSDVERSCGVDSDSNATLLPVNIKNSKVTISTKSTCIHAGGSTFNVYGNSVVDCLTAGEMAVSTRDGSTKNEFSLSDGGSVTLKSEQSTQYVWSNGAIEFGANTKLIQGSPYNTIYNDTRYYSLKGTPSVLKFAYSTTTTTARVAGSSGREVIVKGTKGQEITPTDVVLTIADDTFTGVNANDVVTTWFENMPSGLIAKVKSVSADNTVVTITVSGTPTETSNNDMIVIIPADKMTTATEAVNAAIKETVYNYYTSKFAVGTSIAEPTVVTEFVYDGTMKTCVEGGFGYTVRNNTATNAGSYKAELTLNDGYTWTDGTNAKKEIDWEIKRQPVTGVSVELQGVTDGKIVYEGYELKPKATVKFADGTKMTESDYKVEYANTNAVGTATVTVKANGNYAFEDITLNFEIVLASTPAPTGLKGIAPTAQDGTDGKITGTTSKMEYSTDKEFTSPVDCADSETTGLSQGVYYVRFKATATTAASDYATVNVKFFSVTVTGGSGTGEYREGETVTVTLGEIPAGKTFKQWDFAGVSISAEDMEKDSFTFTMPDKDVKITALYTDIEYSVNIVSGSADKTTVKYGDTITLTANDAPEGKEFKGWQDASGNIVSTDVEYKFTVSGEVNLTAVYADKAVDPVDPVEPTDPTDPTEPTEPTDSTEPTIDKEEPKGLSGGAIAGIVVGSVAVAGIGGFAIFWFAVKKKSFADLGVAIKNGCRKAGNFFKKLGEKIKSLFKKK